MAAATESGTPIRESWGSLLLHIITFSNIDDENTYASGIKRVVGYWANGTDAATDHHNAGIGVVESSGTFTFEVGEAARTGMLYVLSEKTV
jgi:hypothetical protein